MLFRLNIARAVAGCPHAGGMASERSNLRIHRIIGPFLRGMEGTSANGFSIPTSCAISTSPRCNLIVGLLLTCSAWCLA
jgi:hypothetical protein